ncbi:hypothetical protein [Paenarthrobacter sp. YJN-5]|uniref:hypothetical protein n=1 Tax=Paenarthrobacter sp. YJN-5 TaxID=2735316 RepID=UPI001D0CA6DF|nr:hypothetical protein [Paenarthrobacter sp. YJN-5]
MEENAPRQARPAPGASIPVKLSAETLAMPPIRISLGIGHVYKDKADGSQWTLSGLRSGRTIILSAVAPGTGHRDRVSVDTLADNYEHVGCDHENFCCIEHRTHVMPHRGCMLR